MRKTSKELPKEEQAYRESMLKNIKSNPIDEYLNAPLPRYGRNQDAWNKFIEWAREQVDGNYQEKYEELQEKYEELEDKVTTQRTEIKDVESSMLDWVRDMKNIDDLEELDISDLEDEIERLDDIYDKLDIS